MSPSPRSRAWSSSSPRRPRAASRSNRAAVSGASWPRTAASRSPTRSAAGAVTASSPHGSARGSPASRATKVGSSQAKASRSRAAGLSWSSRTRAHQDSGANSSNLRIWLPMSVRSRRPAHQGRLPVRANTRSSSSTGLAGGSGGRPCNCRASACRRAWSSWARKASSKPLRGSGPRSSSSTSRRSKRPAGLSSSSTRCITPSSRGSRRAAIRSIRGRAWGSSSRRSSISRAPMRWQARDMGSGLHPHRHRQPPNRSGLGRDHQLERRGGRQRIGAERQFPP